MKNINKHLYIFALISVFITGCNKDFLEKIPTDRLTTKTFWKTEADANAGLAACYNTLYSNPLFNNTYVVWDGLTDNGWDQIGNFSPIARGPINSQIGGILSTMYYTPFKAIARFNDFLVSVESVAMSDDIKTRMKAEVRFLRGMNYFYLSQLYGGVPIITEPYLIGDKLKSKSTKEAVVKQAIDDIDYAIQNLADVPYTGGNVVKGTAQLMKSKVLMADEKWSDAASICKSIMTSGKFSLSNNFKTLFYTSGQSNNPEIMFSTVYLSPTIEHDNGNQFGWIIPIAPYQNLVDEFECVDGRSINDSPLYNPLMPYKNRDPRLFYSIVTPGSVWGSLGYPIFDPSNAIIAARTKTSYLVRKLWEEDKVNTTLGNHCDADIVLMRYAEVLLNYAEAENEVNGATSEVYAAINKVRARAGIDMPPLPTGLSKDQMRIKIRHERRIEFAFEAGIRYFDLKRWKIAKTVLNNFLGPQGAKYSFEDFNYLWPIPQSEIDYYQSHGASYGQNPGY